MRNEQRYKVGATLVDGLTGTAPATETHYRDRECPAFYVRHMPTGALTYAVRIGRSAKSLGPVSAWIDTVRPAGDPKRRHGSAVAREHAQALLTAHRKGERVIVKRGADAKTDGLALLDFLGMRAVCNDGTAVVGRYPRPNRSQVAVALDGFVIFIGRAVLLASVTGDDLKRWTDALAASVCERSGEPMKRDSVKRYLSDVRTAFNWAKAEKLIAVNPFVGFKLSKPIGVKRADKSIKPRFLDADEERRLRAALAARDVAMRASHVRSPKTREASCPYIDHVTPIIELALATGGRRGALFNLRWKHVERLPVSTRLCFEGKYQKCGQTYYVTLHSKAIAMLAAWKPKNAAPSDLIFPGARGRVLRNIDKAWNSVRAAAKLVNFRFHDLRHTFASKLVQRGWDITEVSKLMGHATIQMTMRYAHLDPRKHVGTVESLLVDVEFDGNGIPPSIAALVDKLVADRLRKHGTELLVDHAL